MNETNRVRVYDGFLKVDKVSYEGINHPFDIVVKNNAIATLCITREGKFVLVSQFRPPFNKHILEVVAGHIEDGNDIEETIHREVMEEIGYTIDKIEHYGSYGVSVGFTTEQVSLSISYLGDKVSNGGGLAEESEEIEVLEYTFEELMQLEIVDIKTKMLLLEYRLKNKES